MFLLIYVDDIIMTGCIPAAKTELLQLLSISTLLLRTWVIFSTFLRLKFSKSTPISFSPNEAIFWIY